METNDALVNHPLSTLTPEETAVSKKKKTALIKKLSNRHTESALDDLGILHRRDEDDDVFTFIPSGNDDSGLSCWFIADGNIFQLIFSIIRLSCVGKNRVTLPYDGKDALRF